MPRPAAKEVKMSEFESKVVLVTGAGRGIGRALATGFARRGARVAANDLAPGGLDKTVEAIRSEGGTAEAFVADVANKLQIQTMIEEIRDSFGRIDILINNAGVEPHASLLELDEYDWDRTLAVNLKGPFLTMQSVGRVMADEGGGVMVNVASIAGRAHGLKDRAAYVASKSGLIGLTREAARELAAVGIRVNAVCPGVIETEMTATLRQNEAEMARWLAEIPQARLGRPDDVVGLVMFLCSEAAGYITGQAINVDGGKVMN
jgi:NAD(P)-dependent dehydrogenase (short-subunit alcohol dehydrogenase family)